MKRAAATNEEPSSKRHKTRSKSPPMSRDYFAPDLRTTARDVFQHGSGDGTRYLSGRAFMVWPTRSGVKRVQMQTEDNGVTQRFEIKLSGKCKAYFDLLNVMSVDCFDISLQGVVVEKKQESSKPYFLPMDLKYAEGVVIRFTERPRKPADNGKVVDTWKLDHDARQQEEAAKLAGEEEGRLWFTPPVNSYPDLLLSSLSRAAKDLPMPSPPNDTAAPSADLPGSTRLRLAHASEPTPLSTNTATRNSASNNIKPNIETVRNPRPSGSDTVPSANPILDHRPSSNTNRPKPIVESNGSARPLIPSRVFDVDDKPKPASRPPDVIRQVPNNNNVDSPKADAALPGPKPPIISQNEITAETNNISLPKLTKKQIRLMKKKGRAEATFTAPVVSLPPVQTATSLEVGTMLPVVTISSSQPGPANVVEEARDPALAIQAGFYNGTEKYTPLSDISEMTKGLINIIALVTSIREPGITRSGEWSCSLTLVDPSNLNVDNIGGYVEGQGCKLNCFTAKYKEWLPSPTFGDVVILRNVRAGGQTLVGYKDKMRWAIFSPEQGKLHHGDRGDAPESEGLAAGFGYEFSPFWRAQGTELTVCLRYADWWRAVLKVVEKNVGRVHQIGGGGVSTSFSGNQRVHRLISEASPDLPPRGFFDCTVEIIKGFLNDNDVYSLYATDYTKNSMMTPVQGVWCPPELADRILKIEMWDAAGALAQTMEPGEYWFLRNCRMKQSQGGYLEGTMQLAEKVVRLEASEAEHNPHFAALLQRKSEWEQRDHEQDSRFEHKLIQDVQKGEFGFLTCTVEVLHVDYNPHGVSYCYITDYTHHLDLPIMAEAWARGLERRIVKVVLWDGQIEMAKNIEVGSYYTIRNLRLSQSTAGDQFQGRLGGSERLINKLRTGDSANERLATLLQNKQIWEGSRTKTEGITINASAAVPTDAYPKPGFNSISEILTSKKCPNKYRLAAYIKDFYPFHLNEFVLRRCKQCGKDIPAKRKECIPCFDVETTVKYLFCFFFLLEDEEGNELLVSVSDEECPPLRGLEPTDFRDDPDSLEVLTKRLTPFLGNLLDVHDGITRGERITWETPMLNLCIDSWQNDDVDTVSYGLADIEPAAN